jgi:maltose phosphorylase
MATNEVGAISYSVKSLNFEGRISFMPIIDGDLTIQLQNPNEMIWNILQTKTQQNVAHLWTQIRRTNFHICTALTYILYKNNEQLNSIPIKIEKEKIAGFSVGADVKAGDTLSLNKYVAILSSENHPRQSLTELACNLAVASKQKGWNKLYEDHSAALGKKWSDSKMNTASATQQDIYKMFRIIQRIDISDSGNLL